jgi:hypothetical protein
MGLVIFLVVLGLLVAVAVMAYNRLVALGQRSEEAWSDVDVQLKRGYFELDRPEDRQVPKVSFPGRA